MKHLFLNAAAATAHATSKPRVHAGELVHYVTAFRRAFRPGLCARTVRAGIIAAGSIAGMDLRQEDAYAGDHLEATAACLVPSAPEATSQLA